MKQFAQGVDRFFENSLIDRAEQAATSHGIACWRNRFSVQWHEVSFTEIPDGTKGMFRGRRTAVSETR